MLVDSHCHLDFPDLANNLPDVLQRMQENQVEFAVCIGVNLEDFPKVLAIAEADSRLFASVGVHPEYTDVEEPTEDQLLALAAHPKVIAIGETGLDYYYSTDNKAEQQQAFREHIRLSRALKKPVIVHTRDAKEDTLTILREECVGEAGGVLHCFTEDWPMAQAALALGMYISISGIVTFRNADALREVTRQIPADRLLIETDSPYLAPVPHRGHQNEPAYVADVAAFIAELRGVAVETLAAQTSENFFRLFSQAQR